MRESEDKKVAERFNPYTEAGRDLYRPNKAEQGELEKLNAAKTAAKPQVSKTLRAVPGARRALKLKGRFKSKFASFALVLFILAGGTFSATFMSTTLVPLQLKEVLDELNDQRKAFDQRQSHITRLKIKPTTTATSKMGQKLGTFSKAQANQLKNAGITMHGTPANGFSSQRFTGTGLSYDDPKTGQRITIDTPEKFDSIIDGNMDFRAAYYKAQNPRFASLDDPTSRSVLRFFKTDKSTTLKGNTEEERKKSLKAIAGGEDAPERTLRAQVDKDGKPTGNYVDDTGKVYDQATKDHFEQVGRVGEQAAQIGSKNLLAKVGPVVSATGAIDRACTIYNTSRMAAALGKVKRMAKFVRATMAALYVPLDKALAGDGKMEEMELLGKMLMEPDNREQIVDESKIFNSGTAANPPLVANPYKDTMALDSPGAKAIMYGDTSPLDSDSARFSAGGALLGRLESINRMVAKVINGGNDNPKEVSKKCGVVQSTPVRIFGAVIAIAAGVGTLGIGTVAMAAGSLAIGAAMPYVLSVVADTLSGNIVENMSGRDFGSMAFVGTAGMLGTMAMYRGMKPLSSKEAVAYTTSSRQADERYAETQRYIARSDPLNITNQYSFLGSLARTTTPFITSSSTSLGTLAVSAASLLPASLGQKAKAASAPVPIERFSQCSDPAYRALNIGADIYCNVRYGLSDEELSMDPIANADWMANTGNIDAASETGEAKDNGQAWNYKKFIKECAKRTVGWGEDQEENTGDGSNCVSPANEPLNKHFRVFTMDKSVNEALDQEEGDGEQPGTTGSGDGSSNPADADGWAYPAIKAAVATQEYKPGSHLGVDIAVRGDGAASLNTPIYAARDGVVSAAGPAQGYGNWIVITHNVNGQRYDTVYGHMFDDGVLVKVGDTVRAGQQIGKMGHNGQVVPQGIGGTHLHFEIRRGSTFDGVDNTIDPVQILQKAQNAITAEGRA